MTYGSEPRRRRRSGSSRRDEEAAEDWVAALRAAGEEQDDPFRQDASERSVGGHDGTDRLRIGPDGGLDTPLSSNGAPRHGRPLSVDLPSSQPIGRPPAPLDRATPPFDRPPAPLDRATPPFDRPAPPPDRATPPFDRPPPFGRSGRHDEPGGNGLRPPAEPSSWSDTGHSSGRHGAPDTPPGEAPARRSRGHQTPRRDPPPPPFSPSSFTASAATPPAAPVGDQRDPSQPHRRGWSRPWRAAADDDARPSLSDTGRHGDRERRGDPPAGTPGSAELKPIITPLPDLLTHSAPASPPPLTPIFPKVDESAQPSRRRIRPRSRHESAPKDPDPGPPGPGSPARQPAPGLGTQSSPRARGWGRRRAREDAPPPGGPGSGTIPGAAPAASAGYPAPSAANPVPPKPDILVPAAAASITNTIPPGALSPSAVVPPSAPPRPTQPRQTPLPSPPIAPTPPLTAMPPPVTAPRPTAPRRTPPHPAVEPFPEPTHSAIDTRPMAGLAPPVTDPHPVTEPAHPPIVKPRPAIVPVPPSVEPRPVESTPPVRAPRTRPGWADRRIAFRPRGASATDDPTAPHRKHSLRWVVALSVVGVLVMIASCALGAYFMVKDERSGPPEATRASGGPTERDISSRDVDPAALTVRELFPGKTVTPVANEPPYQVLKTQAVTDCKVAATDELGALLVQLGCSQVVRGTLRHPTGRYLVTVGLFNLKDEASAQRVHDAIEPTVDAQKGRFTGLMAGTGTEAIVKASTQLGWNVRGHFLAYCVIARTDSKPITADDGYPKQITFDIVGTYLVDGVVGARAAATPTGKAPSGAKNSPTSPSK